MFVNIALKMELSFALINIKSKNILKTFSFIKWTTCRGHNISVTFKLLRILKIQSNNRCYISIHTFVFVLIAININLLIDFVDMFLFNLKPKLDEIAWVLLNWGENNRPYMDNIIKLKKLKRCVRMYLYIILFLINRRVEITPSTLARDETKRKIGL